MKPLPTHAGRLATAIAIPLVLAACTSLGIGTGSVEPSGAPVTFDWTSKDAGTSGTMTATLQDGSVFSGPFLQLTSTTKIDTLAPVWSGWGPGRHWGFGAPFPETEFATQYSGKVVANLQGPQGQRMRCHFDLNSPEAGMRGGGLGQCELANGRTVDAQFARN
jgi:hypothetical protein